MNDVVHEKAIGPRIDRRAVRTRARLEQALLGLMRRSAYEDITVEAICADARVGRSTFYIHYAGKDDLKRRAFEDHLRQLLSRHAAAHGEEQSLFGFSLPILRHAGASLPLFQRLVGGPGEPIGIKTIESIVGKAIAIDLRRQCGSEFEGTVRLRSFLTGAFMLMLRGWLEAGAPTEPQVVDADYRRFAEGALASHLSRNREDAEFPN